MGQQRKIGAHPDHLAAEHVVLGPDHNAAHRDHFHFDMGRYRACR